MKMTAQSGAVSGGGDLCLTMVELSLAQLNPSVYDSGPSYADITGAGVAGFRDVRHGATRLGDGQALDLDIAAAPGSYAGGYTPLVTHSMPYVTPHHSASSRDLIQQTNSLLDFNFDRLSSIERDAMRFSSEATRPTDPISELSGSASGDCSLLDCVGDMAYPGVGCISPLEEVGAVSRRKKVIPRRHCQPATNKPEPVLSTSQSTERGPEKLVDDYSRLVEYVPDCLEKFGFCVVDRWVLSSVWCTYHALLCCLQCVSHVVSHLTAAVSYGCQDS